MASISQPINKVIYGTIKTFYYLNLENKCDKIKGLETIQFSSEYNKAAGKAMTELNQVYDQREEHLQIYTFI